MFRKKIQRLWFRFARYLCKCFCRVCFRVDREGLENIPREGGFLLVCNHQSFLDPLFCGVWVKRPLHFLARDTLFQGVFGGLLRSVNAIPVRRGEADVRAMKAVVQLLREGEGVCLYPEGTRTADGQIAEFKAGLGLLCRRGEAAVVPMVIDGAFECWPRDRKFFKMGSRVRVKYGEPIGLEQIKQMGDRKLAQELTERLRRMQAECRRQGQLEAIEY